MGTGLSVFELKVCMGVDLKYLGQSDSEGIRG